MLSLAHPPDEENEAQRGAVKVNSAGIPLALRLMFITVHTCSPHPGGTQLVNSYRLQNRCVSKHYVPVQLPRGDVRTEIHPGLWFPYRLTQGRTEGWPGCPVSHLEQGPSLVVWPSQHLEPQVGGKTTVYLVISSPRPGALQFFIQWLVHMVLTAGTSRTPGSPHTPSGLRKWGCPGDVLIHTC